MSDNEKAEMVEGLRRLRAEYAMLAMFDERRRRLGHDYGSGQRWSELTRRARELYRRHGEAEALVGAIPEITSPATHDELVAAFAKVGRPRLRRLRSETYRLRTPSSRRTLAAWESLESFYGRGTA